MSYEEKIMVAAGAASHEDEVKLETKHRTTVQIPSAVLGTCTTAAATAAKVVTLTDASGWELKQGASIAVKFSKTNTFSATAQAPVTLNVNNTGAKNIYYGGSANPTGTNTTAFGRANYINTYVYDGTYWVWTGSNSDNNTTYSTMSKSELTTGTATTSRVVRADYLKSAILDLAESSDVDTADNITTFTSSDTTDANANAWTSVTKLSSGEDHKSIFAKMSQMFKNVRWLYKNLSTLQTTVANLQTLANSNKSRLDSNYVYSYTFGGGSESFTSGSYKTWQVRTGCAAGWYIIMLSIVVESSANRGMRDSYIYVEGDREERFYRNDGGGSLDTSYCFIGYAVQNALLQFKTNPYFTGNTYFTGRWEMYRISR